MLLKFQTEDIGIAINDRLKKELQTKCLFKLKTLVKSI